MHEMKNTGLRLIPWLLVLGLGVASCGADPVIEPRRNLLLIAVDTLRADHLGAFGYERETSPAIDRLFESAVVFEDAHSVSSWTLPSFASLLTSTYPSTHDCWQFDSTLDDSFTTLTEILSDNGYRTAAVVSHVFMASKYGLSQGFQEYDESLVWDDLRMSHQSVTSPAVTKKAIEFLERQAKSEDASPWFLFTHYFDPHSVYNRHKDSPAKFGLLKIDRYDGEIAFTDQYIGRLLQRLRDLDLDDDTVIVFVADHGEEFWDHGGVRHGKSLYREVERVPFAIRAPGIPPRRVEASVSGVDLLPTVLDLLRLALPDIPITGRSLMKLMQGETLQELGLLLESRLDKREDAELESYIQGRWKIILEYPRVAAAKQGRFPRVAARDEVPGRVELYDRENDVHETTNVATQNPKIVKEMKAWLDSAVDRARGLRMQFDLARRLELSSEEVERLRQLGYVGGTVPSDEALK